MKSDVLDALFWLDKYHTRAEMTRMFGVAIMRKWYGYDSYLEHNRTAFAPDGLPAEIAHRRTDP